MGEDRQNMWTVYDVSFLYVKEEIKQGKEGEKWRLLFLHGGYFFSMACFSPGVTLYTEPYKPRGVCSKMVRMVLTSGMSVLLSCLALDLQGTPLLELFWSVGRQYVHRDSSVVLEKDAWYFGCSFLWLTELGVNHTYSLQLALPYIFEVFVFNLW